MKLFRQGDVLIREVKEIPEGAKKIPRDNGRVVLAYGEVTGHSHAIMDPSVNFVVNEATLQRYLDVPKRSALNHEEHDEIQLPKGKYEVVIQREWKREGIRNVLD